MWTIAHKHKIWPVSTTTTFQKHVSALVSHLRLWHIISKATGTHLVKQRLWIMWLLLHCVWILSFTDQPGTTSQASVSPLVSMVTASVSSLSVMEIRVGLWLHPCAAYRIYISICCMLSTETALSSWKRCRTDSTRWIWCVLKCLMNMYGSSCWLSRDQGWISTSLAARLIMAQY